MTFRAFEAMITILFMKTKLNERNHPFTVIKGKYSVNPNRRSNLALHITYCIVLVCV